ncbi:MAG: hypothetical protein K2Y22_14035 [Candidatus Obscuribacterales bacterium]|nr:hypothetical protein [Candidatus Obscuribacterales bacterium]
MSAEQIKLLESIRDGIDLLGDKLGGRIDETNAKLGMVEAGLGARIDVTNTKLDSVDQRLVNVEGQLVESNRRLGSLERQVEQANQRVDSVRVILAEGFGSLNKRTDQTDERITRLEHRVDKLEQTG